MSDLENPLDGVRVLDGGLATELEARGHDLDHPPWSAHLLAGAPGVIRDVHERRPGPRHVQAIRRALDAEG